MPERPKPDLDQTREALRQHDERAKAAEEKETEQEAAKSDEDENDEQEG